MRKKMRKEELKKLTGTSTLLDMKKVKEGMAFFVLTSRGWEYLGTDTGCIGPYGTSDGVFAEAVTTHGLSEWSKKNSIELFCNWNLQKVPEWW